MESSSPPAASPRLAATWDAYDAGDMVEAARAARRVLNDHPTDAEQEEANALLGRLRLPRAVWTYGGLAAGLLLTLAVLAGFRGR